MRLTVGGRLRHHCHPLFTELQIVTVFSQYVLECLACVKSNPENSWTQTKRWKYSTVCLPTSKSWGTVCLSKGCKGGWLQIRSTRLWNFMKLTGGGDLTLHCQIVNISFQVNKFENCLSDNSRLTTQEIQNPYEISYAASLVVECWNPLVKAIAWLAYSPKALQRWLQKNVNR